jgi:phosphoribosyl-AMP cyclohydrolase
VKSSYSWEQLKKDDKGLVPVVVQEASTGMVLMVAYMNKEAYELTMESGVMTYWSRSRQELWIKGETSGHYQHVHAIFADCDYDTLLAVVDQDGAACHTGHHSCFFREDAEWSAESTYVQALKKAAEEQA